MSGRGLLGREMLSGLIQQVDDRLATQQRILEKLLLQRLEALSRAAMAMVRPLSTMNTCVQKGAARGAFLR